MDEVLDSLRCSKCKMYLSVFPVKVYTNRSVKCGRCNPNDSDGTESSLYHMLAENLQFPCINRYEGCDQMLIPREMKKHEDICIGTVLKCPICSVFSGQSFTLVEHVRTKHPNQLLCTPSFGVSMNNFCETVTYLYASYCEKMLAILYIRYDPLLEIFYMDVSIVNPALLIKHPEALRLEQTINFELKTVHNSVIYKSEPQRCHPVDCISTNAHVKLNCFPNSVAICKFTIKSCIENLHRLASIEKLEDSKCQVAIKEVIKEIEVSVPCHKKHFPLEPVINEKHDPVMPPDPMNSGRQKIRFSFENIRSLTSLGEYSPLFYLANTKWKVRIIKHNNEIQVPYLSCFLYKVDQFDCSYKVEAEFTVLSNMPAKNRSMKFEVKKFGKYRREGVSWGFNELIAWSMLLDPNWGYLSDNNVIQLELDINLIKINKHSRDCMCSGCTIGLSP